MMTTVTGIYRTKNLAQLAVEELISAGFAKDRVSLVMSATPEFDAIVHEETTDTVRGAITGAVVGGGFAAILVGALALPAIGLVVAGPIVTSLAAGGAGAAAGSVLGGLIGRGLGEQVAVEYLTHVKNGEVVVGIDAEHARVKQAREVLTTTGGTLISDSFHLEHQIHHRDHYLEH